MDYQKVLFLIVVAGFIAYHLYRKKKRNSRQHLIDSYQFPQAIARKVMEKYPHLSEHQAALVMDGLRAYFHISNRAGKNMLSMPSQVVDVAWHEFILFTREYDHFCRRALGRFLHHTPAEAMLSPTRAQVGIKTTWVLCCQREHIVPGEPTRLPVLFALDAALDIPDGFSYTLDCTTSTGASFCASHIGCGSAPDTKHERDIHSCGGE
ncbi:MAG: hypothetical protein ISR73_12480 [Gammaproteobacteria bacterium]|nr:hypothetical protein [Gammaproteobacteria bacterium]